MWLDFIESWEYNLSWVVEYIRQETSKWIRLFYIDNLWFIIKDPKLTDNQNDEKASRVLKTLAVELKISINLIHHFNKGTDKDRKWPRWSWSIRWSAKLEHDSNQILIVYRDYDMWSTRLVLDKDREHWEKWTVNVYFNKWKFVDACPEDYK